MVLKNLANEVFKKSSECFFFKMNIIYCEWINEHNLLYV